MALSERERRALGEIERHLCCTDPRLARAMCDGEAGGSGWTRGCDVVTATAGLTALVCTVLSLIGPAVLAAVLATAAFYLRKPSVFQ